MAIIGRFNERRKSEKVKGKMKSATRFGSAPHFSLDRSA
jgi:hypothetical protein